MPGKRVPPNLVIARAVRKVGFVPVLSPVAVSQAPGTAGSVTVSTAPPAALLVAPMLP